MTFENHSLTRGSSSQRKWTVNHGSCNLNGLQSESQLLSARWSLLRNVYLFFMMSCKTSFSD
jgi:hypothetical protein